MTTPQTEPPGFLDLVREAVAVKTEIDRTAPLQIPGEPVTAEYAALTARFEALLAAIPGAAVRDNCVAFKGGGLRGGVYRRIYVLKHIEDLWWDETPESARGLVQCVMQSPELLA